MLGHKTMKQSLFISLLFPLFLTACGNDDNANKNIPEEKAPLTQQQNQSITEKPVINVKQMAQIEKMLESNQENKEANNTIAVQLPLPQGDLISIVDTGDNKQMTIKVDNQTLTLEEQALWDDWKIIKINPNNVVVRRDNQERTIEIKVMEAPQLSEAEKVRRNQRIAEVSELQKQTEASENQPKLVLTEKQKTLVRSRLLETRLSNEDTEDNVEKNEKKINP